MKQRIYQILFLTLVMASFFRWQPLVFGIALLVIALLAAQNFSALKKGRYFVVLLVPVFAALIAGRNNNAYLIFKDAYYLLIPLVFITAGILLAGVIEIGRYLKTLVLAGVLTSVTVTCISVWYMGWQAIINPYAAHYAIGIVGTPGPPVALACLLLSRKFNIRLYTPLYFKLFVAINILGLYMFASRTYLIVMLCFLFLLMADKVKRTWIFPLISVFFVLFICMPAMQFNAAGNDTFVNKLLRSFSELSIGDYNTEQDINVKYRGYESFMALKTYAEGGMAGWLFGGLGKLVDLKTFVRLGQDADFRYIPILHNGWLYILVKTGIAGIITYLAVFGKLLFINWKKYHHKKSRPVIRLFAALCIGSVLSLLLTNYIVTAFFNMEMSILMITLGYSYYHFYSLIQFNKIRLRNAAPAAPKLQFS